MTGTSSVHPPRRAEEVDRWLRSNPSLAQLQEAFPAEWDRIRDRVGALARSGDAAAVRAYLHDVTAPARPRRGHERPRAVVVAEAVRRRMAIEALRQVAAQTEAGTDSPTLRLGPVNGWVLQRLLFERGLRRKAVRLPLFRLVWPLLTQRRRLMPLVMEQGIYCFYSRSLIAGLKEIIGDRPCLEIAAGDGTLSRLLADRGVSVTVTDDHSWDGTVTYDDAVVRLDAVAALRRYRPEVVLCSWPPPGNRFERHVFAAPSVRTYIVIAPQARFAAGDRQAYDDQVAFELTQEPRLGRCVVPPGVGATVLVFRRRTAGE